MRSRTAKSAHECFGYERTLAVLPLPGDASSIVLTPMRARPQN